MATTYHTDIQKLYVAYFNRPADYAGLNYWEGVVEAANGQTAAVSAAFAASAEYTAAYGNMDAYHVVGAIYQNLFGREAEVAGLTYWADGLIKGDFTVADAVTQIAAGAQGSDLTAYNNKVTAATAFTNALDTTAEILAYSGAQANLAAKAFIAGITTDASLTAALVPATLAASVAVVVVAGTPVPPVTVATLTTTVDTVVGGAGADVINASELTLTNLDSIDGGAGIDTLNISDIGGAAATLTAKTIKNVENIVVTSATGLAAGAIDVSALAGLTSLTASLSAGAAQTVTAASTTSVTVSNSTAQAVNVIGGGGTLTITNGAGAVDVNNTTDAKSAFTSASITGGTTVAIVDTTDASATIGSTLTTVAVSGATGAITLTGKGITAVSATTLAADLTITNATASHTQTLTLNGATAGIIKDTAATTVAITSTGVKNAGITLDLNSVGTTVTVAGDKTISTSLANAGALTSITSTNTAGTTILTALGTGVTFTGGDGADSVSLGATTKAIAMGAGDDTVTLSASPVGGSVDGGAGSDTLSLTEALAANDSLSANATFEALITGFEKLSLTTVTGSKTVDLANLDDISYVKTAAATALVLDNLASAGTIEFGTASTSVTANVINAVTGTADVLNVKATAAAGLNVGTVVAANVETVNFLTDDSASTATGIQHTAALTDVAVKTITVTGDAGLALTTTGAVAVTTFNASAVTKGAVSWTSAALTAASTVTGGAGDDTLVLSAATVATTLNGGAGNDTLTVNNAKNNTIDGGDGNDTILVGNGANTIVGGAGNDSITLGSGANTVNVGAGTNTVVFGTAMAGLNVVTLGAGVDTLDFNAVSTAAGYYPSIVGIAATDKIDLVGASVGAIADEATLGAKITLGGAASFANYLDAAAAADGSAAGLVNWFQFNGNTYVTLDNSATATFADGVDQVIELVGLIDLTSSTLVTEIVTIV
jgi:hypothetical protein